MQLFCRFGVAFFSLNLSFVFISFILLIINCNMFSSCEPSFTFSLVFSNIFFGSVCLPWFKFKFFHLYVFFVFPWYYVFCTIRKRIARKPKRVNKIFEQVRLKQKLCQLENTSISFTFFFKNYIHFSLPNLKIHGSIPWLDNVTRLDENAIEVFYLSLIAKVLK